MNGELRSTAMTVAQLNKLYEWLAACPFKFEISIHITTVTNKLEVEK